MMAGSCPRCAAALEPSSAYCHNCGLDLTSPAGPGLPGAMRTQQTMAPPPVYPYHGYEPPFTPMAHHRALSAMASVVMFVVTAFIIIPGIVFIVESQRWEDNWEDGDWSETRTMAWDFVFAGIFTLASFGMGIVGGVSCARSTRFPLAVIAASMLLVSAIIFPAASWNGFDFSSYEWFLAFYPLMAGICVALVLLAGPGFTKAPWGLVSRSVPSAPGDQYGWRRGGGA